MTRQVWFGTVNDVSPQWYDVSNWVPKLTEGKETVTQKANAYGQWQQLDMDEVWSERDGVPIPIEPMVGMEVLYLDYNSGSPLLSEYYFGGRINAVFPRNVPENKRWKLECDGPEEDFNTVIPHMAFYQATIGNDSARVQALFQAALAEFGLKGTWDLVTQIGGPFISYAAGSYNEYDLKTLGFILADIAADPGQVGDTGYKVPARRFFVSCEWNDPSNPGVGGAAAMVRVLHYYSSTLAPTEPIPLTDRPDQHAFYAYDAFARAASSSVIGMSDTGQVWSALLGTWGIDGTQRAYLAAHAGEDIAVVEGNTADGDVSVTFTARGVGQRLAFRVSSHPATGYKWQGFVVENNSNTSYLVKRYQAGSYTTLGTIAVTPADGDIIKATLLGSSIQIYINGVLRGTYTDTFNQTATLHGISAPATIVGMRWDTFGVWAKGALYWNTKPAIDRTAMINIVTIAGPGSDPQPVGWQNEQGAHGQNDGDLTKTDATDAWDSGATSKQEITEDGASVTAAVEEVMKVQDGFNRTDNAGTLGTAESGQAWNVLGTNAVWGVESNRAAPKSGTGPLYAYTDPGVSTAIVQATLAVVVTGQRLLFRMSDASNLWYLEAQAASYKIYKRVAGSDTLMATYAATPANNDVVKVSLTDNIIKFYLNAGGPFATITDAFNQYATKHGMGTASSLSPRFEDFTVWQTYTTMAFGIGPNATFVATAQDNFDRADSNTTMGSATTGQAWAVLGTSAVWGIQSNNAYQVSGSGALYAYLNTLIADGIMQVTFDTVATGARALFRMVDAANLWYIEAQAAAYKVYKRVAGVETLMATYAATPANGDIIRVALDGANIKVYVNGTGPMAAISDAFNQTATKHGIGVNGTSAPRFNDFSMWPPYWKTIPFAWLIQAASRTAQPSEMGTLVGTPYTYTEGDRFKVAVRPVVTESGDVVNEVRYYVNDQQKLLSTIHPSPTADVPFYAQGAIYNAGATLSNVTIKLLSYTTVTDDASVQLWGPKPAKDVVHRDDLDTRVKRQALGDAIVGRHGSPRITVPLDTLQEYHEGRIVLLNNEKQGWQNLRIMVATAQRKVKTATVLYSLQLGETDIEYGDEEPLGLLMKPQLFDNTDPDKPTGLAATGGVRDGTATVSENFTWDRPTNDARWIHLLITRVGGPTGDVHPLAAQTGKGTIYGLKPATAYTVRAKYEDWNGNFSEYTSPAVPFTTPQIIVDTFKIAVASGGNTYDPVRDMAAITIDRTDIIGINIIRYFLQVTETLGSGLTRSYPVDFLMAQEVTFYAACSSTLQITGYAVDAGGQTSNPSNVLTITAAATTIVASPTVSVLSQGHEAAGYFVLVQVSHATVIKIYGGYVKARNSGRGGEDHIEPLIGQLPVAGGGGVALPVTVKIPRLSVGTYDLSAEIQDENGHFSNFSTPIQYTVTPVATKTPPTTFSDFSKDDPFGGFQPVSPATDSDLLLDAAVAAASGQYSLRATIPASTAKKATSFQMETRPGAQWSLGQQVKRGSGTGTAPTAGVVASFLDQSGAALAGLDITVVPTFTPTTSFSTLAPVQITVPAGAYRMVLIDTGTGQSGASSYNLWWSFPYIKEVTSNVDLASGIDGAKLLGNTVPNAALVPITDTSKVTLNIDPANPLGFYDNLMALIALMYSSSGSRRIAFQPAGSNYDGFHILGTNGAYIDTGNGVVAVGGEAQLLNSLDMTGITTKTSTFTADNTTFEYRLNATIPYTATLPPASGCTGRIYTFKMVGTGKVTLDANGSETIDGLLTYPMVEKNQSVTIQSNGTNWDIIAQAGLILESDGTRWLGPEITIPFCRYSDSEDPPYTHSQQALIFALRTDRAYLITEFVAGYYVIPTNDASHYWDIKLDRRDSSNNEQTLATLTTSNKSGGTNATMQTTTFSNNPSVTTDLWLTIELTKVSTPGNLYLHGIAVYGRVIYT